MAKSFIVMGEAPESGSEEEIDSSEGVFSVGERFPDARKGRTVVGEGGESDEDATGDTGSLASVSSAVSASSLPSLTADRKSTKSHSKNQSLLTKKLCEKNAAFYKNLNDFVSQTVANGEFELSAANQQLVKCQIQLQEAAEVLKTLNSNVSRLDSEVQSLLSLSYIPDITVKPESNS